MMHRMPTEGKTAEEDVAENVTEPESIEKVAHQCSF